MKKIISLILALSAICSFYVCVAAETNYMSLVYSNEASYEIEIPSITTVNPSTGSGYFEISVDNMEFDDDSYVSVVVTSDNYDDGWYLVDVNDQNNKIPYTMGTQALSEDIVSGSEVMVEKENPDVVLFVQLQELDKYGTFTDTITFVSEVSNYKLSGTWIFNEDPGVNKTIKYQAIDFVSNSQNGSGIDTRYSENVLPSGSISVEAGIGYDFGYVNIVGDAMMSQVYSSTDLKFPWDNEAYRTLTFTHEQKVTKEFYKWFTQNAVQQ